MLGLKLSILYPKIGWFSLITPLVLRVVVDNGFEVFGDAYWTVCLILDGYVRSIDQGFLLLFCETLQRLSH